LRIGAVVLKGQGAGGLCTDQGDEPKDVAFGDLVVRGEFIQPFPLGKEV
jgi:hypothetical protein